MNENEKMDAYEEMLNELHHPADVAGYTFPAGTALRQLDPIAFREEFLNYQDTQPKSFRVVIELEMDGNDEVDVEMVRDAVREMLLNVYDDGFLPDNVDAWMDSFEIVSVD